MEKQHFIHLLQKHLNGESTVEEDDLVISYYNLFESEEDVLRLLDQERKDEIKNEIYASIRRNIAQNENSPVRIRYVNSWPVRSAAAAVFIIVGLGLLHLLNRKIISPQTVTAQAAEKKPNRAFHLPDGSMVILNYGSKISYAAGPGHSDTRDVYLEGQAFFDIHEDPSRPFIVHADKVATTVLGTAFNVKALKGEAQITITVARGKVKVGDEIKTFDLLTRNQQVVYDKMKGSAVKNSINALEFMQWKDHEDLSVDDVTFEETTKLLEDKFGVAISFKDPKLKNSRFTTVLLKKEKLEQVITTICEFNGAVWEYNKEKKSILISEKKTSFK
jgi:transmembrane sensor